MTTMKSATGRWVTGDDFFDRESELKILKSRIEDGNHVLLAGQRRMGKTSIARELGRILEQEDWVFLYADVEDAETPEDMIAEIAEAGHPVQGMMSKLVAQMKHHITDNIDEISAYDFKLKVRAGLDSGSWKRRGEELFASCAKYNQPVFLVIDELPIFLTRLLHHEDGHAQVENFLSWFRRQLQTHSNNDLVILVSGSIGLEPLVRRLGLSDRINHLEPFRVGPWNEEASKKCLNILAENYKVKFEAGVPEKVYELLGIGIPHHVQSFFTRLREDAIMHERDYVSVTDVERLYINGMLGPSGQNDLAHYEKRLHEGLDDESHKVAMEILTEAAVKNYFDDRASACLVQLFHPLIENVQERITEVLEVLQHDGYLGHENGQYQFESRLLKDWWFARYQGHYQPLCERLDENRSNKEEV